MERQLLIPNGTRTTIHFNLVPDSGTELINQSIVTSETGDNAPLTGWHLSPGTERLMAAN